VSATTFGHLVHLYPPFKLVAISLTIWSGAVILSGLAPHYWVMVLGRTLSGVGEGCFQCVIPPWIDDNAPAAQRSAWLA
jgi:MFS family permease